MPYSIAMYSELHISILILSFVSAHSSTRIRFPRRLVETLNIAMGSFATIFSIAADSLNFFTLHLLLRIILLKKNKKRVDGKTRCCRLIFERSPSKPVNFVITISSENGEAVMLSSG